jgi:hypothetical protein
MLIDGVWRAYYTANNPEPFTDESDPDESAIVIMQDGVIMGRDPWGLQYSGRYTLNGSNIHVILNVSAYTPDAHSVIPGLVPPYQLDLKGEFNSSNYFSVVGEAVGAAVSSLVVNCQRMI